MMELFSCVLMVCGILSLLWCVTALLLFPAADADMTVVWEVWGDCPELEFRIRAYLWLSCVGFFRAKLRLLDCGMTEDARRRAEFLARDHSLIECVDRAAAAAFRDGTVTDERDRTRDPARRRADGDISEPG